MINSLTLTLSLRERELEQHISRYAADGVLAPSPAQRERAGVRVAAAQERSTTTELIWITGTVSV